jgi:hypothetical protein
MDGRFAYPDSGDVFDARTHRTVAQLTDGGGGQGKRVSSSKMIEVHFRAGAVVAVGDQFGLGRRIAPRRTPGASSTRTSSTASSRPR